MTDILVHETTAGLTTITAPPSTMAQLLTRRVPIGAPPCFFCRQPTLAANTTCPLCRQQRPFANLWFRETEAFS